VLKILVAEGEVVPVGAGLVVIGEPGEVLPEPAEPAAPASSDDESRATPAAAGGRVSATPLVRKVAQELGVDLAGMTGTGPGGRITEDDVRAAASGVTPSEGRRAKLRGVRRVVAERLARAHAEVPAVTWVEECDFEEVDVAKLVATVMKACAESMPEFPELNARLEGDEVVFLDRYDFGLAVQTEQGLLVPVVRGVDSKSVDEILAEIGRLVEGARDGSLRPEELRDSTFTVTSGGKLAGLFQTPIVNHPEVAILSIGRIEPRPVVRDGEIVVRSTGTIALSFDHRVIDGMRAAGFGLAVIGCLQSGSLRLA
jgi:pyruvate dehydrogenase E2 component (dihydrolipoamide acetyltransferase)